MQMKQPAEPWKDHTLGKSACHPSDHPKHNPYVCTYMVSWIFLLACWEVWSSGCAYKYLRPLREGSVRPYHATSSSSSWAPGMSFAPDHLRHCRRPGGHQALIIGQNSLPWCSRWHDEQITSRSDCACAWYVMPKMNWGSMATSTCRYVDYREYSRAGADKNLEVAGLDFAHMHGYYFFARGWLSTSRAAESSWPLLSRYILC